MFYKPDRDKSLSRAQLEQVRRAFRGRLVRSGFPADFIIENSDELLATAHVEYVRALDKGWEIEDPVGWLVHCAWRRTQNLLKQEGKRPRLVSTEKTGELVAEAEPTPEELALGEDRAGKIRRAVEKLSADQRRVVALVYFEGMSFREAARFLGWSLGKVQRCHNAAIADIRRRLPFRSGDELEIDIGMAAWLSLAGAAGAHHLPAGFEAVLERAEHEAAGLWARVQDLARRFALSGSGGGNAASAVASSGVGRAAGACAAGLTVACLASGATGIIGPGIGALTGDGGGHHRSTAAEHRAAVRKTQSVSARTPEAASASQESASVASASASPAKARNASSGSSSSAGSEGTQGGSESARVSEPRSVEQQTAGVLRAASESTEGSSAADASNGSGEEAVTVSPAPSRSTREEASRVKAQTSGIARAGG